jgi:predicted phosphate transport protein (TIGR00153 family)
MFAWFQRMLPRQGNFFEQFEAHVETLTSGADALARLFEGGPEMDSNIQKIIDLEHQADDITRDVLQSVRRTFLTPFDRGSITSLIARMDDAIDEMQQTAMAIDLYEFKTFDPEMKEIANLIVNAAKVTATAIPLLRNVQKNAGQLHDLTEQLVRFEGQADNVQARGMKALFKLHGEKNPGKFIFGRTIYVHLEKVTDRFEDVANEIDGLVIDHA